MLQWNTTCVQMTDFGKRLLYYDVEYTFKAFTSYKESDKYRQETMLIENVQSYDKNLLVPL